MKVFGLLDVGFRRMSASFERERAFEIGSSPTLTRAHRLMQNTWKCKTRANFSYRSGNISEFRPSVALPGVLH